MQKEHQLWKNVIFGLTKKYIAGTTMKSALQSIMQNSVEGFRTTVTFLNDNVDNPTKAKYNANTYIQLIKQASRLHLHTDVSLRLAQIGAKVNGEVMRRCLGDLMEAVDGTKSMLWIEHDETMDDQDFLDIYRSCKEKYSNIGFEWPAGREMSPLLMNKYIKSDDHIKLTAYDDIGSGRLSRFKSIISRRLGRSKAATAEATKRTVEIYKSNLDRLISKGVKLGIHGKDDKLTSLFGEYKKNLTFELPLGCSRKNARKLARMKLDLSIYTPYGKDWASYIVNRVATGHKHIREMVARVLDIKPENLDGADGY